jgi:hypothetical protein
MAVEISGAQFMMMISLFQRVLFGEGRRTWFGSGFLVVLGGSLLSERASICIEVTCLILA